MGGAIALGNFDGVHLGHQAVLKAAAEAGARLGAPLAAATFQPMPREVFAPNGAPFRLQSSRQRARALQAAGAQHVFEIHFDHALSQLSDERFSADILAGKLGAKLVCVGEDFRYGADRAGNIERLKTQGAQLGFEVVAIPHFLATGADESGARVSSTMIREALQAGDAKRAAALLSRPWAVEGVVERGFQRGRELGVPTANVSLGKYLRPRLGVYAARAVLSGGENIDGVASIGVNPTTGELAAPLLEMHLFDFDRDIYGQSIEVALLEFLRPERKFESLDALRVQMQADIIQARESCAQAR